MPENLTADEQSRVLGAEAPIWGEDVDDFNIDQRLWLRAAVFAERVWSTNETIAARVTPWPPTYASADIVVRMIKHRCRLLQRGLRPEPYDSRDVFPRRSPWVQCETTLPLAHTGP
jgi:hexosaminidase